MEILMVVRQVGFRTFGNGNAGSAIKNFLSVLIFFIPGAVITNHILKLQNPGVKYTKNTLG